VRGRSRRDGLIVAPEMESFPQVRQPGRRHHRAATGIAPEVADKVFDPFFSTKEHGAGLGLSIAYEIVHAHHGDIRFILPQPVGALCQITLPIKNG